MSTTSRARYVFTVKEYADGTPWIYCELLDGPDLPLPGQGFIGFDLPAGTSYERAMGIANFMNDNLPTVSLTTD